MGVVVPVLPGAPLILGAAVAHKLLLPAYLSWWTVGALGVLTAVELALAPLGAAVGARWGGASRWALVGAVAGLLAGLPFGPLAWLAGALAGAAVAETAFAGKSWREAMKAAAAAGAGLAAAGFARVGVALGMIALALADCFLF